MKTELLQHQKKESSSVIKYGAALQQLGRDQYEPEFLKQNNKRAQTFLVPFYAPIPSAAPALEANLSPQICLPQPNVSVLAALLC